MKEKLLKKSIEHWKQNLENFPDIEIGAGYCSLCQHYTCAICNGCPIAMHTKVKGCKSTPYSQVAQLYFSYVTNPDSCNLTLQSLYEAVEAEVKFLEHVLEKMTK